MTSFFLTAFLHEKPFSPYKSFIPTSYQATKMDTVKDSRCKRCHECRLPVDPEFQYRTRCRHMVCGDCWKKLELESNNAPVKKFKHRCPICNAKDLCVVRIGYVPMVPPEFDA